MGGRLKVETKNRRFWDKAHPEPMSGCWLWMGAFFNHGYGKGFRKPNFLLAHRVTWELIHGAIPENLLVLHKCDVPSCINPRHLFLGTALDNSQDCYRKDRQANNAGEYNPRAKLTRQDVARARESFHVGKQRVCDLARKYGVSWTTMNYAIVGKTWR